jgi:hypothetical protein
MAADAPRAQLIRIETDRRLGHEWDEWDGKPLPNIGDFSAPPGLFFRFAAVTMCAGAALLAGILYLLSPRLALIHPMVPGMLAAAMGVAVALACVWFVLLLLSFYGTRCFA